MNRTGGEPDAVGFDKTSGEYILYDFSGGSKHITFHLESNDIDNLK